MKNTLTTLANDAMSVHSDISPLGLELSNDVIKFGSISVLCLCCSVLSLISQTHEFNLPVQIEQIDELE